MLKKILLLILTVTYSLWGQNKIMEQDSIQLPADSYIGNDSFNNLYYLQNNILFKQESNRTLQYGHLSFGSIQSVDINNPLKVLLYYKNANQLILLDSQLNLTSQINLNELEDPVITKYAGMASLNKIWIVDQQSNQIKLLDRITQQIKTLTPSIQPTPIAFKSSLNQLFWLDEQNQLFQTDLFGKIQLINTLENDITLLFVNDQLCIYQKDNKIYLKKHLQNETILLTESAKSDTQVYYMNQFLSIFTQGHLQIKYITY